MLLNAHTADRKADLRALPALSSKKNKYKQPTVKICKSPLK